jgi:hypothetical protein
VSEKFLAVKEIAALLNVSCDTVCRRFRDHPDTKDIGPGKGRPIYRIPERVVKEFLEQRGTNRRKPPTSETATRHDTSPTREGER